MKVSPAQQLWANAPRKGWCRAGLRLTKRYPRLSDAWRNCRDGAMMAYWLAFVLSPNSRAAFLDCRAVARKVGCLATTLTFPNERRNGTAARYATAMRARFNSDGTVRKRSKQP